MEVNIFKKAARKKLRFESERGELTVEQLYDLPLAKGQVNLDSIARQVNRQLKDITEESFVDLKPDPRRGELELRLDILKEVIADKLAEKEASDKRLRNAEKRRQILDALAAHEERELGAKSKEDLLKELEAIDD